MTDATIGFHGHGGSGQGPLGIALVVALSLHVGLVALMLWRPVSPVAPAGEDRVTIDLAPAASEASMASMPELADAVAEPVEMVEEVLPEDAPEVEIVETAPPPLPEVVAETAPELMPDMAEAAPAEPVVQDLLPPPAPDVALAEIEPPPPAEEAELIVAPPETVAMEVVTPPKPQPKPRQARPKPVPAKKIAKSAPPKRAPRPAPSMASTASAGEREAVGGRAARADPNELNRYIGRLRSWLERHKRYPPGADGATGVATLRFTIDRGGRVLSSSVVRGSGSVALDGATMAMLRAAAPLPSIPADLPQSSLTVSVPVRFAQR